MFRRTLSLALLAAFVLPASALAQDGDDDADGMDSASPSPTLVISSWKCDFRKLGEINAAMDSVALPVYQAMVDEGLVQAWGIFYHDWADEWNLNFYTVTKDKPSFFAAWTEAGRRIGEIVGDSPNPVLEYCTEHKDGIYTLGPQTDDDGADE